MRCRVERHEARSLTTLHVTVHESLRELDAAEWDSLVRPGSGFHGYRALRVFEEGGLVDCPLRYFCFRDEHGQLVAHATAFVIRTSLVLLPKGALRDAVGWIRKLWPGFLRPRMLEFGCPISPDSPLCTRDNVVTGDLLDVLARAADAEAARSGIHYVVIRDFERRDLQPTAGLHPDFVLVSNLPTTVLHIRWATFEDYLSSMRSRYRTKVVRGLALAERAGLTARMRLAFSDMAIDLVREWKNVHDHADVCTREELTAEFYRHIGGALEGGCRLIEILRDGRRVAHALAVVDGRWLRWIFFGRDRAEDRDGAYFLAIASVVRLAIDERLEAVEMGLTTYLSKTDFGADMVPLWILIRFRGAIRSRWVPRFLRFFNPVPLVRRHQVFRPDAGGA
jgi:predicted N-acyltransferase